MRHWLLLAWRYMTFHRWKSILLVSAITLTLFLPITVYRVVRDYERSLMARAVATPLLVGAKGSRFDLALHALYFRGRVPDTLTMADAEAITASELAVPTPLHVRFSAEGFPIVGTTLEYFEKRGLRVAAGTAPLRLGDCIVGSRVASSLGLGPGDRLRSDPENVFDLAGQYPLDMRVTGVFATTDSPDDTAVFVDCKTAWILEGLGHGHQDLSSADDSVVLGRTEEGVVANAALPQYTIVTDENVDSFHFHGESGSFPITAIVAWPVDAKSETLLRGRYLEAGAKTQALVPVAVVEELFGLVFRIKKFFDAQAGFVALSTVLFLILVILLSLRLRLDERRTMHKIGCSRVTVFWLHAFELGIVFAISTALAVGAALVATSQAPRLLAWLMTR